MYDARPSFPQESRFARQSLQPSFLQESHYVAAARHMNPFRPAVLALEIEQ